MGCKTFFIVPFLFAFIIVGIGSFSNSMQSAYVMASKTKKVIIDPGHGGRDPGTINENIYEKEITLDVAKKVKKGLEAKGISGILTRSEDTNLLEQGTTIKNKQLASLMSRIAIANKHQAQVLISIHVNSNDNPQYFGPQTYYRQGLAAGQKLADKIQEQLLHIRMNKRKAIVGNYYLLNKSNIPAALIEIGFMSNKEDRELLLKDSYRQLLADAVVAAISEYLLDEK